MHAARYQGPVRQGQGGHDQEFHRFRRALRSARNAGNSPADAGRKARPDGRSHHQGPDSAGDHKPVLTRIERRPGCYSDAAPVVEYPRALKASERFAAKFVNSTSASYAFARSILMFLTAFSSCVFDTSRPQKTAVSPSHLSGLSTTSS